MRERAGAVWRSGGIAAVVVSWAAIGFSQAPLSSVPGRLSRAAAGLPAAPEVLAARGGDDAPKLAAASASKPAEPAGSGLPVSVAVYDRTRLETWQFFSATPHEAVYPFVDSLLRLSVAQTIRRFDWQVELSQPAILHVPDDAVSPIAAQGQLGLGGTYYAANGNNRYPAAASLKQGFVRYRYGAKGSTVRLGRFEFFDGQELTLTNKQMQWLQTNRIGQRLIGNFGFSNGQRSFDGAEAHYARGSWELTGVAARADQGVFNMNGNPELNTDFQYLAWSRKAAQEHVVMRTFAIGYHDGRTGLLKTDNRSATARALDHRNIRLGTYGADVLAIIPAGKGSFDLLGWGVLQNGRWGLLDHRAAAAAGEMGYRWGGVPSAPWIRGGFFRGTGDENPNDGEHNTFFQLLPTPRNYARMPFFNQMNNKDQFVELLDTPTKKLSLRSDLRFLQLTTSHDLWYQGGGAYDNKVFGYTGRPSNGHASFTTLADVSADYQVTPSLLLTAYYAHAWGKSVIAAIYPRERSANFGCLEMVYRWGVAQRAAAK